jgi:hypothetical protein
MALVRRLESAWSREGVPVAVRALALITLAGGVSALLASVFPASPEAIELLRILGVVVLCGSLLIWWLRNRVQRWFLHMAAV